MGPDINDAANTVPRRKACAEATSKVVCHLNEAVLLKHDNDVQYRDRNTRGTIGSAEFNGRNCITGCYLPPVMTFGPEYCVGSDEESSHSDIPSVRPDEVS